MPIIVKMPNVLQGADRVFLVAHLTPFPPAAVQAALDALHTARGENASCGCRTCVEQFGDDVEFDD